MGKVFKVFTADFPTDANGQTIEIGSKVRLKNDMRVDIVSIISFSIIQDKVKSTVFVHGKPEIPSNLVIVKDTCVHWGSLPTNSIISSQIKEVEKCLLNNQNLPDGWQAVENVPYKTFVLTYTDKNNGTTVVNCSIKSKDENE